MRLAPASGAEDSDGILTRGVSPRKTSSAEATWRAARPAAYARTKPRHAWTNGFVERLQQTILTEHWRVVFRRHNFTNRATLDRERPHHGYQLRGRTPATVFRGAVAAARGSHASLWAGRGVNTNPSLDTLGVCPGKT